MTALTRKQLYELEAIRGNLRRAVAYLQSPEVVGIAHATKNPNGASYTIVNPACINSYLPAEHVDVINRFIGSDIAGVYTALHELDEFLDPAPAPTLF
jgi:hypothetical protein